MVMTRTSDEIKKGLACADVHTCPDEKCPYYASCAPCELQVQVDALALIQQLQAENAEKDKSMQQLERSLSFACDLADGLKAATVKQEQELYVSEERNRQLETQNAELSGKIGQLEAERDAAVNDLHYLVNHPLSAGPCYACLHSKDCWRGGDCDPVNDDRWQWRGICKEGH